MREENSRSVCRIISFPTVDNVPVLTWLDLAILGEIAFFPLRISLVHRQSNVLYVHSRLCVPVPFVLPSERKDERRFPNVRSTVFSPEQSQFCSQMSARSARCPSGRWSLLTWRLLDLSPKTKRSVRRRNSIDVTREFQVELIPDRWEPWRTNCNETKDLFDPRRSTNEPIVRRVSRSNGINRPVDSKGPNRSWRSFFLNLRVRKSRRHTEANRSCRSSAVILLPTFDSDLQNFVAARVDEDDDDKNVDPS